MTGDDTFQPEKVHHYIYAAEPPGVGDFYAVRTSYWETDAMNAVGQVVRFNQPPGGVGKWDTSLNTSDNLSTVWASPEGNLWVGSCDGRMWTTASVPWDPRQVADVDVQQNDRIRWKGGLIPRRPNGNSYNVAALWGSSDRDVYVATFEGFIFHWDGAVWTTSYAPPGKGVAPIVRMHGTSPSDVWAVGRDGLVLHYDGKRWGRVPLPGDETSGQTLTGVWAHSPTEVYICSTSGAIFHGSQHGLERLGDFPQSFYGVVELGDELYLAGGDAGPCALRGNQVTVLKDNFAATGVYRLEGRIAVVEPVQAVARVIIHQPGATPPWAAWGT